MLVTSIRDRAADRFLGFAVYNSTKVAVRDFIDSMAVVREGRNDLLVKHPDDFDLYLLGTWNEDTGIFVSDGVTYPLLLLHGSEAAAMLVAYENGAVDSLSDFYLNNKNVSDVEYDPFVFDEEGDL